MSIAAHMNSRFPWIDESDTTAVLFLQPDYHLAFSVVDVENPAGVLHPEDENEGRGLMDERAVED